MMRDLGRHARPTRALKGMAQPAAGRNRIALRRRQRGFTLFEMLMTLVVIALGVTIAAPLVRGPTPRQTLEAFARTVANDIRATRSHAITHNTQRTFFIDVGERKLGSAATAGQRGGTPLRTLPPGLEIDATGATRDVADASVLRLTFYPDGSSGGARLVLRPTQPGAGISATIDVEWLSGRVSTRFRAPAADGAAPGMALR